MPVSQSRLLICLFSTTLLSTTVFADSVVVNTATDENKIDNQSCSLREAIAYINAKKAKKAVIDEAIAVISGTSIVLSNNLNQAKQDLDTENAKATPDAAKITQLTNTINALTAQIDASLFSLNRKLNETEDALAKEQSKETPNTTLITSYEASIDQFKKDIATKNEEKTVKETELKDYREKGLYGCTSNDDSSEETITLPTISSAYTLDAPLTINFSVTINNTTITNDVDSLQPLEENSLNLPIRPIIKANGAHTLFIIDDEKTNSATTLPIFVTFNNIDFMGCEQICATNGGIILNKEILTLTRSVISKGRATFGGAIYNAPESSLIIQQSVIRDNQALDGAAIFSANNTVFFENSLITQNQVNNPNNSIITIDSETKNSFSPSTISYIANTTISGNSGTAISAYNDIFLNNNTIVNNTIGVRLNNKLPSIYNSIIAGNTQADCELFAILPNDNNAYFANNLSVQNKGCPTASAENHNIFISNTGNETLLAALDNNNRCAAPPAVGLLCPLNEFGGLTKTHKPRLLANYTKLTDSPIVNRGFNNIANNLGAPCQATDQRGSVRENNENQCDIGAVEIQTGLKAYTQGDDIVYGQIKRFSPFENIGDAELLPASECSAILGAGEYLNGCIKLIDLPKHGIVQLDKLTDELVYSTTNSNFHGFDKFSYSLITTLSRFSDAANDRSLKTDVKIVSEPPASLASKALDNGSINIFSLLILSSLLAMWRRPR